MSSRGQSVIGKTRPERSDLFPVTKRNGQIEQQLCILQLFERGKTSAQHGSVEIIDDAIGRMEFELFTHSKMT